MMFKRCIFKVRRINNEIIRAEQSDFFELHVEIQIQKNPLTNLQVEIRSHNSAMNKSDKSENSTANEFVKIYRSLE
jgi:hypothetical protein